MITDIYKELKQLLKKYSTKIRISLSVILILVTMYQFRDFLLENITIALVVLCLLIIAYTIHYYTITVFNKKDKKFDD